MEPRYIFAISYPLDKSEPQSVNFKVSLLISFHEPLTSCTLEFACNSHVQARRKVTRKGKLRKSIFYVLVCRTARQRRSDRLVNFSHRDCMHTAPLKNLRLSSPAPHSAEKGKSKASKASNFSSSSALAKALAALRTSIPHL